jgi:hypothetical protein
MQVTLVRAKEGINVFFLDFSLYSTYQDVRLRPACPLLERLAVCKRFNIR